MIFERWYLFIVISKAFSLQNTKGIKESTVKIPSKLYVFVMATGLCDETYDTLRI